MLVGLVVFVAFWCHRLTCCVCCVLVPQIDVILVRVRHFPGCGANTRGPPSCVGCVGDVALWSVLVHVLLTDLSPSPGRFLVSFCKTDLRQITARSWEVANAAAMLGLLFGVSSRTSASRLGAGRYLPPRPTTSACCLLMVLGQQQHPHKVVLVSSFVGLVVRTTHTHNS